MSFLSQKELKKIGFKSIGSDVLISNKCSLYAPENISIGNNVRIDDFSILSAHGENGNLTIGNNIHIAAYVGLYAGAGIIINDFCGISSRSSLYSTSDDYSGEYLFGPIIPNEYLKIDCRKIILEKYSLVGAHSLILPGVTMHEGSALGAMSLSNKNLEAWVIYGGIPAKKIKKRKKDLIKKAESINKT